MALTTIRLGIVVVGVCIVLVVGGRVVGAGVYSDEIAFVSARSGSTEIHVMDIQRGFVEQLTTLRAYSYNPAWSPDGMWVAFETTYGDEYGVWAVDASGQNARRLIPGRGGAPDWSPDGTRIVFSSERDGNFEIYTANVDGTDIRRLTFDNASDHNPAWSPDGVHIIFQSNRNAYGIYSMDINGGDLQLLTDENSIAVDPAWSADGARIVFTPTLSGGKNLHVMDADGGNVQAVTAPTGTYDGSSGWSPDGGRIVFDSDRYRNGYTYTWGIYEIDVAGGEARLLTPGVRPVWRPRSG